MPDLPYCENCGNAAVNDSPSGLCPNCLLRTAIEYGSGQALAPLLPRLNYFGDYELLEEIARGGMGVVYRAKQASLNRIVAVKMMRPGLLSTDAEIRRFQAEARTAAALQHPNIVAIHEVGEFDGLHYFSMDFVDGPSLAALVRERPLSPVEAARYVQTLAEAVQYAHARGVLHRDLKPSNVLVDSGGRLRITDFGLARPLEDDDSITSTGAVMGTPAYMPPEQASGRSCRLGPASDVYSLGAILYELLTGRPPFRANSQLETVRLVLEQEPVPPRALNREAARELEAICLHALQKDPARRYQSAAELAADLQWFLGNEPVHARSHRVRRWTARNRWPLAAATTAALAFTAVGIRLRHHPQPPSPATAGLPPAPVTVAPPSSAHHKIVKKPPMRAAVAIKPAPPRRSQQADAPVPAIKASLSPDHGVGYSQVFIFHYTVPDDSAAIREVDVDFHDPSAVAERHCVLFIDPETGLLQLQFNPNGGPGLRVSGIQGTLARLENPVCIVDLTGVSEIHQGNDLDIRLPMTFKPSFEGLNIIESRVWAKGAKTPVESQGRGQWLVGADERNP